MKYIYQYKNFFQRLLNIINIKKALQQTAYILLLSSCQNTEKEILSIKTSPIQIENFETEIFSINAQNLKQKDSLLSKKYYPFYQYFIQDIVYYKHPIDSSKKMLLEFVNDKDMQYTYKEAEKIFPDKIRTELEKNIHKLHQHLVYYFPNYPIPKKYLTFISGFNYQILYPEKTDIIGIGLDMYLGKNHQVYQWLQWPRYRINQLQKEYIIVDIAKAWLFNNFPPGQYNNLLENMMYYGKILYALKKLLPDTHDTLIFSYTQKQLNYCTKYEKNLWAYFIEENKLYSNSPKIISAFLNDGPFTAAISKECPPRIAMYLAYKIIKSYAKHHSDITLEQIFHEQDAQKILSLSKYKP